MATIKTIGNSGQISLGKQYAGRHVVVEELEQGVWMIKLGDFVPDNERWLQDPEVQRDLDEALDWAARNPPRETDLKQLKEELLDEEPARSYQARSQ
jgi:hypothetical protein